MAATQFIVEDAVNGFSVTPKETGKSGKYWNIALPHLLGSDPVNGGGLLFLMESMNGTERTSQISVQWNETFNSCPRGSLQIPPGVVSQIPPPARQDKGLLV